MNPTVNMMMVLEKELELERQGLRRTRRWIGDASQVTDARWYQRKASRLLETSDGLGEVSRVADPRPCRESVRSTLARLLHLSRTRRQPASSDC